MKPSPVFETFLILSMVALVLLIAFSAANGQTRPRPEQLRNIEQIRIGNGNAGDDRPGTLIRSNQINDGRFTDPHPQVFEGQPDEGKPTVCIVSYYRIQVAENPGWNVRSNLCYTQYGLGKLLEDPAWATWWEAHKNDQGAALTTQLVRKATP